MSDDALLPQKPWANNSLRHGHARHGEGSKVSPTYQSWLSMRARCRLKSRKDHPRYSALGYCAEWENFETFLADMGERPEGTTLDRRDNAKGYDKDNCRWATASEQARNTRRSKLTLQTATEVALRRLRGESCVSIAAAFGISESLPREIIRGRTWPDALLAAKAQLESDNG